MDHVMARVKRLKKKPFYKLVSDHTLYESTNISLPSCIPYSPDHNLDDDSWFKVEQFSRQSFCIDLVKEDFDSKDFDDLKKEQFPNISYIFSVQGGDFYFQKITPSLFVSKKILGFGEVAKIEESTNRLIVNDRPDAVYFKKEDTLVFRNLATISSVFKGIDELYREATQQETEKFLQESFIELKNGYDSRKVSKPNRKRIALAMDSLAKMSLRDRKNVLSYINDYCGEKLKFDKNKNEFEISTDDELKNLLYGIEQRFYTTPFGNEKRLANSVVPLE